MVSSFYKQILKKLKAYFQEIKDGIVLPSVRGPSGGKYVYMANEDDFRRFDEKDEK